MLRGYSITLIIIIGVLTIPDWFFNNKSVSNAEYLTITEVTKTQEPQKESINSIQEKIFIPPAVTIAAPFFPQAPDNKWVLPRAEACSEANLVLAAYYIKGKELNKSQFKKEIIDLTKIQEKAFWTYIEIPIHDLKSLYDTYYPNIGKSRIIENPTIENIKQELSKWHLIIIPTAWRKLENPHFFGEWPRFHTVLVRWYDDTYFYTNEVGMMKGENFKYPQGVIMNAMHDLVEGDITQWAKRILVIGK